MIKIKICGITNHEDATLAASLGADYAGFNFYKDSPRKVSVKAAKEMTAALPGFTSSVGIFVDEPLEELIKIVKKCGLKNIQLHGNESPEYCREAGSRCSVPVIKAIRVADETAITAMQSYLESVNYFLLDTASSEAPGGTGAVFNWDIAVKAKELNKPFFLAGGLTPENVADAIEKVRPFGIDTASGVERLPRRKDYEKMKTFITAARRT